MHAGHPVGPLALQTEDDARRAAILRKQLELIIEPMLNERVAALEASIAATISRRVAKEFDQVRLWLA